MQPSYLSRGRAVIFSTGSRCKAMSSFRKRLADKVVAMTFKPVYIFLCPRKHSWYGIY